MPSLSPQPLDFKLRVILATNVPILSFPPLQSAAKLFYKRTQRQIYLLRRFFLGFHYSFNPLQLVILLQHRLRALAQTI